MSGLFGEVRSLLNQAPDAKRWGRLCELLDQFDPARLDDMVIPYVEGSAARWPAELRVAPESWVLRAIEGEELLFWSIVRKIDVSYHYLDASQILELIQSERLERVELLDLSSNRIGAAGARALTDAEWMRSVQWLGMGFNAIGSAGAIALADAGHLDGVEYVDFESNELGDHGVRALSGAGWFSRVKDLSLKRNRFGGASAMEALLGAVDGVTRLVLDRNNLSRAGVQVLSGAALPELARLELRGCEIRREGLEVLSRAGYLAQLEVLDLGANHELEPSELIRFIEQAELSSIEQLYLPCGSVTDEVVAAASARFPERIVKRLRM